ncbi:MAG: phosphocholine cytidylyltransferase family protein [Erythrobacter sp.]
MDAMILAAGFGSRLACLGEPKPLVQVAGVALIELSIRQAAAAGFTRFVVVTGHCSQDLERYLDALAETDGFVIEHCRVDDWSRPNGYSVLAGAERIGGNYLLMMADHIFSVGILEAMARQIALREGALLAIDRNLAGPAIDPDDATFVKLDDAGHILAIGKHLVPHDAVDCGAFVATPDLAAAIAAAISEGAPGSLTDGMRHLADSGTARTLDVTGQWWIDVDDPSMHAMAERQVQQHLSWLAQSKTPASVL